MSLPESSYDYNQNYFQILKTKQTAWIRGETTNEEPELDFTLIAMKLSDTEIKRNSKEKLGFNRGSGANDNTNVRNLKLLLLLLLLLQLLLVVVSENWFLLVRVHYGCLAYTTFFNWRKFLVEVVRRCQLFFGCQQPTTTTTLHDKRQTLSCPRANESNDHAENTKDKSLLFSAFSRVPTHAPKRALGRYLKVHSHLVLGTLVNL